MDTADFPEKIGQIFLTRCATPGCHTEQSKLAAGNLCLSSWEKLLEGGSNGASVVPFRPDFSPLLFSVNSFPDIGPSLQPLMPFNAEALTRDEVSLLKEWISQGAPNKDGMVKFTDNTNRSKYYIANQACDVVAVVDAETQLPMRYINVGTQSAIEVPHMLRVSPDGKYWYVVFTAADVVQKFSTADDHLVGSILIGNGNWNTLTITADSKKAFIVDWSANGRVKYVDLENLNVLETYQGANLLINPHGSYISSTGKTLYVTAQTGNFIYKIDVSDPANPAVNEISLQAGIPPIKSSSLDVHEIIFSPDESKYFVSCQKSNEVRVMNTANDSLLAVIAVGIFPQEMGISESKSYLFVTCPEDTVSFPGVRGSVGIIDYQNLQLIKKVNAGFQPHGIAVDDARQLVVIANRNVTLSGPAPHHPGSCGGRNGYLTFLDMNSLQMIVGKRLELAPDPYTAAVRK